MDVSGDDIAEVVLKEFEKWPSKRKPLIRSDGVKEWVPLTGVVAQDSKGRLTCLAAATGMKCLPQNKIPQAQGITLHDWHAEILAIRSLNAFLLGLLPELHDQRLTEGSFVRRRTHHEITETHFQPYTLQEGIKLHMYCSEAPCGDASMELTVAAQEDSTPWDIPSHSSHSASPLSNNPSLLHGRGYFSNLGAVRGKPSRPDAPPTLSKSCSDKLSLKESTSLLSSLTSLLISPENAYLTSLTLPSSQYSSIACNRAFSSSGRLAPLKGKIWNGGYRFQEFKVLTTSKEFAYSRRQVLNAGEKLVSSNIAAAWTPVWGETLIGGTVQGHRQFAVKGASRVCKQRMWKAALLAAQVASAKMIVGSDKRNVSEISGLENTMARDISEEGSSNSGSDYGAVVSCLEAGTYREVKGGILLGERRRVKEEVRETALKGWVRNEGGEAFGGVWSEQGTRNATGP